MLKKIDAKFFYFLLQFFSKIFSFFFSISPKFQRTSLFRNFFTLYKTSSIYMFLQNFSKICIQLFLPNFLKFQCSVGGSINLLLFQYFPIIFLKFSRNNFQFSPRFLQSLHEILTWYPRKLIKSV